MKYGSSWVADCPVCRGTNGGHYKTCPRYGRKISAGPAEPSRMTVPTETFAACEKALREYSQYPTDYHRSVLRMKEALSGLIDAAQPSPTMADAIARESVSDKPKFDKTFCSQCGAEFGPGNAGFSSCASHQPKAADPLIAQAADMLEILKAVSAALYLNDYGDWALDSNFNADGIDHVIAKATGSAS